MRGGSGTTVAAADRQAGEPQQVVSWAGGRLADVFPEAGLFPADVWLEVGPQWAV